MSNLQCVLEINSKQGQKTIPFDYNFSDDLETVLRMAGMKYGLTTKVVSKGSLGSIGFSSGIAVRDGGSLMILRPVRWVKQDIVRGKDKAKNFAIYTSSGRSSLVRTLKAYTLEDTILKFVSARKEVAQSPLRVTVNRDATQFTIDSESFSVLATDEAWSSGNPFKARR